MWSRAQLLSRWDFLLLSSTNVTKGSPKKVGGDRHRTILKSVAVDSLRSIAIVMVALVVLVVVIVGNVYTYIYVYMYMYMYIYIYVQYIYTL